MAGGWYGQPSQPSRRPRQQLSSALPPPAASERSQAGLLWAQGLQRVVGGQEVEINECPEQKDS